MADPVQSAHPPVRVRASDLDDFLLGATVLGSGGGGDPELFRHLLADLLPEDGVALHPPDALPDCDVVAVGMIGATSVLTEKLPHGGEIGEAVDALTRWTRRPPGALAPVESAGVNAAMAVAAAVVLDLPLVDADLMGRALPRFDQITAMVVGPDGALPLIRTVAAVEPAGHVLVQDCADPGELERTLRGYVSHSGGWAGAAFGPVRLEELAPRSCHGTLARAVDLGRRWRLASEQGAEALASAVHGRSLAGGRVVEVLRRSVPAGDRVAFAVLDHARGLLRVEAENEYLLAVLDGRPEVTCPDLICVLDGRTGLPVSVDRLRAGDDVQVVAVPGPEWWVATAERTGLVGPRSFGLDLDPVLLDRSRS